MDARLGADYGFSPLNPIECFQPIGERAVIEKLRCPAGHRFIYRRHQSMAKDKGTCRNWKDHDNEARFIDMYKLECTGGEFRCDLYFCMYHPLSGDPPAPSGLVKKRPGIPTMEEAMSPVYSEVHDHIGPALLIELTQAMQEHDEDKQIAVVNRISQLGYFRAVPAILRCQASGKANPQIKLACRNALASFDEAEVRRRSGI